MGKPFKREYSASTSGFTGMNTSLPAHELQLSEAELVENFHIRSGAIVSSPRFRQAFAAPIGATHLRGLHSFKNLNNYWNTVAVSPEAIWALNANGTWTNLGALNPLEDDEHPYAMASFLGNLFITKGVPNDPNLIEWLPRSGLVQRASLNNDGTDNGVNTPIAGARFLMALDDHLLMAYTYEPPDGNGQTVFPYRIRWSANGLPTIWDPTFNVGAGFNDIVEFGDEIAGMVPLGTTGYLFRTFGISQIFPVGGIVPFGFNHLWSAQRGIGGSFYPWAIAAYGNLVIFGSTEDFYMLTTQNLKPITGKIRTSLYKDLDSSVAEPSVGTIVPRYGFDYPFYHYQINIPFGDGTTIGWTYSINDDIWTRRVFDAHHVTSQILMVATNR